MNFDIDKPQLYINRVFRRTSGVYKDDLFRLTHNDNGYVLTEIGNAMSTWSHDGTQPFGSFYPSCTYWELMFELGPENVEVEEDTRELI